MPEPEIQTPAMPRILALDTIRISSIFVEDIGDIFVDQIGQLEQHVLLAILRRQPEAYGIAIQDELKTRTGREYSTGAIYAVLDKLERKGFVSEKLGEATAQRGGRAKIYFQLTAPGHATLETSLSAIKSLVATTSLAKVFR